jgi:WD40 repeat protein
MMAQKQEAVDQLAVVRQYVWKWLTSGPVLVTDVAGIITEYMYEFYGILLRQLRLSHVVKVSRMIGLPSGKLATASDHKVQVWDTGDGRCLLDLSGHEKSVCSLTVTPDGKLKSKSTDYVVVWDTDSGARVLASAQDTEIVNLFANVSLPDGKWASAHFNGGSILIWDKGRKTLIHRLMGHTQRVNVLVVLPCGKLVSGSDDGTIKVWDTDMGVCMLTLADHGSSVQSIVILPCGKLVSFDIDYVVKVWDTYKQTCVFTDVAKYMRTMFVSPDGKLIQVFNDNSLRVWC